MTIRAQASSEKFCRVCGRGIEWRRKWAENWEQVRYCSRACRQRGLSTTDQDLEQAIMDLLSCRVRGATLCPSEAARRVAGDVGWRALMESTRMAARRLCHDGRVVITQRGRVVDPDRAKGPIRLRLSE
jgi:hypothetical protein